ncbi:SIS domain-containing protein [Streptomyces sp. NPDC093250]|uniref:SIS domain-containing protein n=1 Tax=Streptomyces sp. NPDC093250 TaxID=3366036 RepID=UPI0037FD811F
MTQTDPGALMRAEMAEQPERVALALEGVIAAREHLARIVRSAASVVLLGRGSSRSAATYAVHALRSLAGKPAFQLSPAELGWGGSGVDLSGSLVVAISQSGQSREVLAAAERAVEQGGHLLVVTNSPDSPLARLASDERSVLDCRAGRELAVPATKSFTTTCACLLAVALADSAGKLEAAYHELPPLMQRVLQDPAARFDLTGLSGFVLTGEGFAESVAEEGAIKIRETLRTLVASLEGSEFLHGSVNSVRSGNAVVAVGADPLGSHLARQAVVEAGARGAATVYIGPEDSDVTADQRIALPAVPAEWVPFLAIPPIQRAAHDAALAAGFDPDTPAGLNKITRIDDLQPARA